MLADQRGAITLQDTRQKPWFLKKQPEKTITEEQYLMYLKTKPRHLVTPEEYEYLYGVAGADFLSLHPSMRENRITSLKGAKAESNLSFETKIDADWRGETRGGKDKYTMGEWWSGGLKPGQGEAIAPWFEARERYGDRYKRGEKPERKKKQPEDQSNLFKPNRINPNQPIENTLNDIFTQQGRANKQPLMPLLKPRMLELTKTITRQRLKTRGKSKLKEKQKPKDIIPPPPIGGGGTTLKMLPTKKAQGAYQVLIRSGGKWTGVGMPLPKRMATKLGIQVTARTPARSFKLLQVGSTAMPDIPFAPSLKQYRKPMTKSRLGSGVLIEKSAFAINTPGEYQGITLKGLEAKRIKAFTKNKWRF